MGKMIYLDNAATTKTAPEGCPGNAAIFFRILRQPVFRIYEFSAEQRGDHQDRLARRSRKVLGAKSNEIYLPTAVRESDNWALILQQRHIKQRKPHYHNKD